MPGRSDAIVLVALATLVAGFDQLTKAALISVIFPSQANSRLELVDGLVSLEYAENRGAAFGLLAGLTPVLALVSVVILAALLFQYSRQPQPPLWQTFAAGLIVGGALGNLVDRVRLGYVIDFVSVGPWPHFNVADAAITIGFFVWLYGWLRSEATWGAARTSDQES